MPKLYIEHVATCRCGKRISEHALATRKECPKCGRQWHKPEARKKEQEEARRRRRDQTT